MIKGVFPLSKRLKTIHHTPIITVSRGSDKAEGSVSEISLIASYDSALQKRYPGIKANDPNEGNGEIDTARYKRWRTSSCCTI